MLQGPSARRQSARGTAQMGCAPDRSQRHIGVARCTPVMEHGQEGWSTSQKGESTSHKGLVHKPKGESTSQGGWTTSQNGSCTGGRGRYSGFFFERFAAAATAPLRMKSITGARMSLIFLSVAACVFAMRYAAPSASRKRDAR